MSALSSPVHTGRRPRILIADDHVLVAGAIKNLLEREFEVVGIVSDGNQLVASIDTLRPDVVVLDISMPTMNGLDAGERIRAKNREIKLIYITMSPSTELAAEAFRLGASAFVLKNDAVAGLSAAIRHALRGKSYISPGIDKEECGRLIRIGKPFSGSKTITLRQQQILRLLAEGMTAQQVGYQLNIKPGTVAHHKHTIMEKLGIKTSAALLHYTLTQLHSDDAIAPRTTAPGQTPTRVLT